MSALSKSLSKLAPAHRGALEWFQERRGLEIPTPTSFNGISLVNPQTGIQKPANWQHALSVKQTLAGDYPDAPAERRSDGSWLYDYAKQRADAFGSQRTTNNSLIRCAADDVPVAVIIQTRRKNPARYEVLGLARVVGWSGDFFRLEGYNDAGEVSTEGAATLPESNFQPITPGDWRKKIIAEIAVRQGGKAFRAGALSDYGGRCLLSDCEEPSVLEAAHIVPYRGAQTDGRDNALLLRSDLHTLFDREAIWIDPHTLTVRITKPLKGAEYRYLDGYQISLPSAVDAAIFGKRLSERDAFLAAKQTEKAAGPKI